ncbi:MAG TPA: hypothetical protein VK539_10875 [Myxococcaceae bacterium]|nr:hypothetical protein [Myxococcaceae bacterium]
MSLAPCVRLCAVLLLPLAAGCLHQQRPYTFNAPAGAEAPIDTLVRALAAEGFQPAIVATDLGIVHTRWDNQGICYGPEGHEGTLLRRFTATVAPTVSSGSTVSLRADVQCCASPEVSPDGANAFGPCALLAAIYEAHQREVDSLGAVLRDAMARSAR